jgi:hypothetical protein
VIFLSLALYSGGVYDLYGKRILGGDVFIAGACFFVCLFGASSTGIFPLQFPLLIYLVALACFFHILFNNSVEGGLKDVDHDALGGAKTTTTRLGVSVKEGKLVVTTRYAVYMYLLKLIYIGIIFYASFQPELTFWISENNLVHLLMVFLVVIIFATMYRYWHPPEFNRPKLIRLFALHEIAAYFIGPIILISFIGAWLVFLLLLIPFFWFILWNFALYGKPINPQV